MALDAKFFISLFVFLQVLSAHTQELPKLSTKQTIDNLRFVSKEGTFTYYQRRNGTLLLSKNFEVTEVLKGSPGTHYQLSSTIHREKVLITQDTNYHDHLNLRAPKKIYALDYGDQTPQFLGEGLSPKLHVQDTWISYYQPSLKKLIFRSLQSEAIGFEIELKNIKNPYFIPQARVVGEDQVIYTDLNEMGVPGVLLYDRKSEEIEIFSRADSPDQKIEICTQKGFLYIMTAGTLDNNSGTILSSYPVDKLKAPERKTIYESVKNDLGNMICEAESNKIFFIKNTANLKNETAHEVAQINLEKNNELSVLTQLKYATQLINLDGRIIIPYRNDYFVAQGDHQLTVDDKLAPIPESDEQEENNEEN